MPIASNIINVSDSFLQALEGLHESSRNHRSCPEYPDKEFILLGVHRVLELSPSGRGFLQEHGLRFESTPRTCNYFAALRSDRRLLLLADVAAGVLAALNKLDDRLAHIPELAIYSCFALDGHWHKAAAHDPRHEERKMAVGHLYSLNLRTHGLRHLAAAEGLHENDMSMLKRTRPAGLRQDTPKGKRSIIVYDKASIDFDFWARCRKESAVYFISRRKESMVSDLLEDNQWDQSDARNNGVTADCKVVTREGHVLRIVHYTDPATGQSYEFLTNQMDLPPGVIADLYRRRWHAEKVFDEIKNKLGEVKAWGTTLEARGAQAKFISITHNLLGIYEHKLKASHGIQNKSEDKRRAKRKEEEEKTCRQRGAAGNLLVQQAQRATQHTVKFIRWLRQSIRDGAAEGAAVLRLMQLYARM